MQNSLKHTILEYLKKEKLDTKLKRPIILKSAKSAGYKINKTFTLVSRYRKGNHRRPLPRRGRKPSKYYSRYSGNLSHKQIVAGRVLKKFNNCKVIGIYYLFHHTDYNYYQLVLSPYEAIFSKNR